MRVYRRLAYLLGLTLAAGCVPGLTESVEPAQVETRLVRVVCPPKAVELERGERPPAGEVEAFASANEGRALIAEARVESEKSWAYGEAWRTGYEECRKETQP